MSVEVDRGPAQDVAKRELTDPRYEHRTWWDDFMEWLGKRFFGRTLHPRAHEGFWDANLMPLLVLLVVVVLGVLIFIYARRAVRGSSKKGALFEDGAAALTSSEEHRQRSRDAAGAGDWSTAVAERVRAVVKELDERAVLTLTPGRTADEFAFLAGGLLPELEDGFAGASKAFDEVVYGGRAGSERAYLDVSRLDEAIPQAVRALRKVDENELVEVGQEGPAW